MLGKEPTAMCTMPVLRSSANHHPQEHFYWKEFISQVYQRCPPVYFPASRDCEHLIKAVVFTQGQLMLQTRCYLQDAKVTASCISIWPHIALINYFVSSLFCCLGPFSSTFKQPFSLRNICMKQELCIFVCIQKNLGVNM